MAKNNAKPEKVLPLDQGDFWQEENVGFFGIEPPKPTKDEEAFEELKDADEKIPAEAFEKKKPEAEEEQVEDEDFTFGAEKPATATDTTPAPAASEKNPKSEEINPDEEVQFFTTLAKTLTEKGIFQNVEIKDGDIIDGEKLIELQDQEIEARLEETFESFFQEMDEDGIAFLKYKKAGGDTRTFLNAYSQSLELPTSDLSTEEGQEKMLRYYYKNIEKLDAEDVDDRIEWAKEGKKMEKLSLKYSKTVTEMEQQRRDQVLLETQEAERAAADSRKEFETSLVKTLQAAEEIEGVPVTKEDKASLGTYLSKPVVKIGKNKYITGMQADIQKIWQDKDRSKLLLLAKFVKAGLKLEGVEKKAVTKKVAEVKKAVFTQRNTAGVSGGSGEGERKSLADYW